MGMAIGFPMFWEVTGREMEEMVSEGVVIEDALLIVRIPGSIMMRRMISKSSLVESVGMVELGKEMLLREEIDGAE